MVSDLIEDLSRFFMPPNPTARSARAAVPNRKSMNQANCIAQSVMNEF